MLLYILFDTHRCGVLRLFSARELREMLQRIQFSFSCIMKADVKCYFISILVKHQTKPWVMWNKTTNARKWSQICHRLKRWRERVWERKFMHVKRYLIRENVRYRMNMIRILMIELQLRFSDRIIMIFGILNEKNRFEFLQKTNFLQIGI